MPHTDRTLAASVVIPASTPGVALWRTMRALAHQTTPCADFEVIVVADGWSDQDCAEFGSALRSLPFSCQILSRGGMSPSAGEARNAGAAVARAQVLLFLDADIIAHPGLIERHISHLCKLNRVVLGVRRLTFASVTYGSPLWPTRSQLSEWIRTVSVTPDERSGYISETGQPNWGCLYSHNFSLYAELFRHSGGFDPGFQACGVEDVELGYRLYQFGAEFLFADDAVGIHQYHKRSLARITHRSYNLDHLVALHPELTTFRDQVLASWTAQAEGRGADIEQ